ncbi:hypothetical protein LGR54_07025 [Ancylobacter sp. Lp-2]|uniref:inositol monophosphatase family protein n=1 Tax=Ancylobacter sp. Lp-2 TaxID=2881339 RepID=UPI001E59CA1B|nr:inositol monophosphatase family protein [Ancylobacter sp. Lp-2]MCB4768351.1 hypothetical protein [Ancylobacter sp. Lp-2]
MNITSVLESVIDRVTTILPEIYARRFDVEWKPDGSPVTKADVLVEQEVTTLLRSAIPGITVLGEETFVDGMAGSADGWVAVLDPIDGTENFCSGLKEWGVSLSIWNNREHAGSLIFMPELGEYLISGRRPPKLRSRILGISSTVSPETMDALKGVHEARIMGCAVYNLYNVARGAFARFLNPKGAYSWDLLAGVMLARENGCDILIDGHPYDGTFLEAGRRYRVDIRHRYDLHSGQGSVD